MGCRLSPSWRDEQAYLGIFSHRLHLHRELDAICQGRVGQRHRCQELPAFLEVMLVVANQQTLGVWNTFKEKLARLPFM